MMQPRMAAAVKGDSRFSALEYGNSLRSRGKPGRSESGQAAFPASATFEQCVEEVRNYLSAAQGRTEEERQQYNESLNRAILGYEADRIRFLAIINDYLAKKRIRGSDFSDGRYESLAESIFAEVIGLNVLEVILKQKEGLEEIQVVGREIYEVRNGEPLPSTYQFRSLQDVERIQQNLVLYNNERINLRKKWAEVRLLDGSRVTMTGFGFTAEPTLTLRFYTMKHFSLQTLCHPDYATIDQGMFRLIRCLIRSHFNMVVIGPTNSGKTNLIKAFIGEMPDHERIITIEPRFELMLKRDFPAKNIVEYEVSEDDPLHNGRQAFKLALRQSPKRICHAEIRDEDANLYVRACTRGHEGSITSVHVSELEDVPEAVADMCMMDGRGMNPERLTRRIARYVTQIGIEMGIADGKRKVLRIGEFDWANDQAIVRDIVRFEYASGRWLYSGKLSDRAVSRMQHYDRRGYEELVSEELIRL